MTTRRGEKHLAEPRRRIIPHLARYGLLISLAAMSLTSLIVGARTDDSRPLPLPSTAPTTEQTTVDQCRQQYSALRQDVEAKAQPIRDARDVNHGRISANTMTCKLFTALGEAESRMIDFVKANSNRCGFSIEISEKIGSTHVTTEKIKGKACKTPELRWRE
jgi:hypothetical protein